jgi:hypothetical protein
MKKCFPCRTPGFQPLAKGDRGPDHFVGGQKVPKGKRAGVPGNVRNHPQRRIRSREVTLREQIPAELAHIRGVSPT